MDNKKVQKDNKQEKSFKKYQNNEYLDRMDNLVRLFKGEKVVNK